VKEVVNLEFDLLDRQVVDSDGLHCGRVDDVELTGGPGGKLVVAGILVGTEPFLRRLPDWIAAALSVPLGASVRHVRWRDVERTGPMVHLRRTARSLRLRGD
jgi:hypothetical protein